EPNQPVGIAGPSPASGSGPATTVYRSLAPARPSSQEIAGRSVGQPPLPAHFAPTIVVPGILSRMVRPGPLTKAAAAPAAVSGSISNRVVEPPALLPVLSRTGQDREDRPALATVAPGTERSTKWEVPSIGSVPSVFALPFLAAAHATI